jgi:hypothetical protein
MEVSMRVQRFTLLVSVFALLMGAWSKPLEATPTQPPASVIRRSSPNYDLRARQAEAWYLQQEQAAQRRVIVQKRRLGLSRLRQQERTAKKAAARQCLLGSQGFCSRLVQIEPVYAQKRVQLERSLAKEQAQKEAALSLERELSQLPD